MGNKLPRRAVEAVKSLLILLLALSTLGLTGRALLQYGSLPSLPGWLERLSGALHATAAVTAGPDASASPGKGLRPVSLAVSNRNGRYGVQYDSETLNAAFESQLGGLLGEALTGAGEPYEVSEEAWRRALDAQTSSVYYDFLGGIPLSNLSLWLGGEENASLTGCARRLLLAPGDGNTALLYYTGDGAGAFYACATKVEIVTRLDATAADYTPNNAVFAFQQAERYPNLGAYVMILSDPPSPAVYSVSNPIAVDSVTDDLLRGLSFHPQTSSIYAAVDGRVVQEGRDTLRISSTGTVFFSALDSQSPRYSVSSGGADPSQGELVDTALTLVERGLAPWCGEAGFYLIGIEEEQDGGASVYLGYLLNGAPVALGEDGYAARVVFRDGAVSEYTLCFRAYQKTEATSAVLPEAQAVAAMNALQPKGNQLLLCYPDSGGAQATAGWVAK